MSQRAPEGSGPSRDPRESGRIVSLLALAPWLLLYLVIVCGTVVAIFAPDQFHDFVELTRTARSATAA